MSLASCLCMAYGCCVRLSNYSDKERHKLGRSSLKCLKIAWPYCVPQYRVMTSEMKRGQVDIRIGSSLSSAEDYSLFSLNEILLMETTPECSVSDRGHPCHHPYSACFAAADAVHIFFSLGSSAPCSVCVANIHKPKIWPKICPAHPAPQQHAASL